MRARYPRVTSLRAIVFVVDFVSCSADRCKQVRTKRHVSNCCRAFCAHAAGRSPCTAAGPGRDLPGAGVVKDAVEDILKQVLNDHPNLKDLSQEELVATAGDKLLAAERPDFKAYGYMMLLWYGDEAARQTVADSAATLQTPEERAHFYFVMGLGKIRSDNPEVASQGRDYIRQMRDSGHVTFVNDALWDQLITDCQISE